MCHYCDLPGEPQWKTTGLREQGWLQPANYDPMVNACWPHGMVDKIHALMLCIIRERTI